MRYLPALALTLGTLFVGNATAAPYVGLMYGNFSYKDDAGTPEFEGSGPSLRLGMTLAEWIGLEVRGGFSDTARAAGVEFKVKQYGTGLVRLGIPSRDKRLVPYAFGGVTYAKFSTNPDVGFFDDLTGVTYGFGVDLFADAHRGLTFEWMRMDDEEDGVEYEIEHLGISYTHRF